MDKDSESLMLAYVGRCVMCRKCLPHHSIRLSKKLSICPHHDSIDRVLHIMKPHLFGGEDVFDEKYGTTSLRFTHVNSRLFIVRHYDERSARYSKASAKRWGCPDCAELSWSSHGRWRCSRCGGLCALSCGTCGNNTEFDFHCDVCGKITRLPASQGPHDLPGMYPEEQ